MLLLIVARRGGRPVSFAGITPTVWLAGCRLGATSMLYILALSRTSAATTLFLLAATPVFAAAFGWIVLRERVERATMIAIGVPVPVEPVSDPQKRNPCGSVGSASASAANQAVAALAASR